MGRGMSWGKGCCRYKDAVVRAMLWIQGCCGERDAMCTRMLSGVG